MTTTVEAVQNSDVKLDPQSMTVAQLAKVLSAAGGHGVTEGMIRRHIERGAPATADGHINLVHYAAWLNKEDAHGD